MNKTKLKAKLKFEPYYNTLTEHEALEHGYFYPKHNKIDWKTNANILCTPLNFLSKAEVKNPVVLISTGALCPLHQGHVDMMIEAKNQLTLQGYDVIGGYLSPGHDEYIKDKVGDNWMPIHHRIKWASDMIKQHTWLSIDPWEGVFAPGAVNFTTVVHRLELYLKKHFKSKVQPKIFFVCGGDNARFIKPFIGTNVGCVVVKRPGYHAQFDHFLPLASKSIIFTKGQNELSSTIVRKSKDYIGFKKQLKKQLYFRLNDTEVESKVLIELQKHFSVVWPQYIESQRIMFENITNDLKVIVLNLDADTYNYNSLEISRLYDLFGHKKLGYTSRNKKNPIDKQIKTFIKNNWQQECYLFDDDICTGSTMDFVESKLKEFGIKVLGRTSFISGQSIEKEVLDSKDFILGFENGGLMTEYNNQLIRIPYIYPFVCPYNRASINNPLDFSIAIWQINLDFWKYSKTTINNIKNLNFLTKLGFKNDTLIKDVCAYYLLFLKNIKSYNDL